MCKLRALWGLGAVCSVLLILPAFEAKLREG